MAKRQTIGENPLDSLFEPAVSSNGNSVAVLNEENASPQQKAKSSKKTTHYSPNLCRRY